MASRAFKCSLCDEFAAPNFGRVFRHIKSQHSFDPGFRVGCSIDNCPTTYTNFASWRSHIYRKHRKMMHSINEQSLEDQPNQENSDTSVDPELSSDIPIPPMVDEYDQTRAAAQFILKIRDGNYLTQTVLNSILPDVTDLFDENMKVLHDKLLQALERLNANQEVVSAVTELLEESMFDHTFQSLNSEYRQNTYFIDHLGMVEPIERVLGREIVQSSRGSRVMADCCYDVPLLSSLQSLLNCDKVVQQIFNPHISNSGVLEDYCDGRLCRSHPLFSEDPHALQLLIYYDDVEVSNPLGSAATVHKLGLFYYTLANLHPRYRSLLSSIQLLCVVKSSLITKYGMDTILEPFIDDVKRLESDDGVEFVIGGQKHSLRGSVALALADNPASQALGGYKCLASALRKCRHCLAVDADIQTKFTAEEFEPRTKETHNRHCSTLNGPLHSHIATTYGLSRNASLNTLRYFHVTSGLPPDIMHDVLEGALHVEIKCLLTMLIKEQKLFRFSVLNSRISSFPYGDDISDHPKPLPESYFTYGSIKLGASETWALARMLPLIIGDLVPEDSPYWKLFLLLLDILDLVMSPKSTPAIASYLRQLIQEHHTYFCELYPDRPLTPKLHYIVHIPNWILQCGPLTRYWCMRFEAKHRYFKKIAKVVGNFTNIAKTLAYRQQRYMCYILSSPKTYLKDVIESGPAKSVPLSSLDDQLVLALSDTSYVSEVSIARWVKIHGTKYQIGNCVIHKFNGEEPCFIKIKDIVFMKYNTQPLIIGELLRNNCYHKHFHAYDVTITQTSIILSFDEIADHHPLSLYQAFSSPTSFYIVLKYYVLSAFDTEE